ncbi:hemolysin family protein [Citricoccus nitrophenolicus]|uniref:CBS domain containing-hemolysin-like protein n=1 Tax=Citricoccus muralis TaxID=169134 RepID=A0A3D9L7S0_9MICC|nr:hemolysin family protein [Citricoccus muralis]REE02365.1 CBS domain containing-hemolysin-like protein [Citricoccus muralis]
MEIVSILIGLVLIIACGLFVAAEFALITVNKNEVREAVARGDQKAAGVLEGMNTLSTQLSGAQLGITLTNLGIGFLAEPAIASLVVGPLTDAGLAAPLARSVSVALALVLATVLTMVFGELVPKNLAIARPLATARAVVGFQRGFSTVTKPLLMFFNGTANRIVRLFGIEPQEELASARSPEELTVLVRHSARQGVLPADTAELIQRSFAFGNRRAHDSMTPSTRMTTLAPGSSVQDLLQVAATTGHSRFPVMEPGSSAVEGLVHIRRGLAVPFEDRASTPVSEVMETPTLMPDTIELDHLMDTLRAGGLQMAVLMDETGDVAGLITLEDLVEELVGEVVDEHDPDDLTSERMPHGVWAFDGALRPDEVSELLGHHIAEDPEYDTIAGLITLHLGHIATVGDSVELETEAAHGYPAARVTFAVEAMDGARIARVHATATPLESQEDDR